MEDGRALAEAFKGAEGVFILPPNEFDPSPGFPEARAVIDAVKKGLEAARPRRVVCLSTIGAQADQPNLPDAANADGTRAWQARRADDVPQAGLVYGEFRVGYRLGA